MKRLLLICISLMYVVTPYRCSWCQEKYWDDTIHIGIKSEYKEKFEKEEFTISDFQYDNVESFRYSILYDEQNGCIGTIYISLKKHGTREVKKALKHFEKLEFVGWVQKSEIVHLAFN